jgi:hypothetical protein
MRGWKKHAGELGAIAHQWFEVMRKCGDEIRAIGPRGLASVLEGFGASDGYVNYLGDEGSAAVRAS